MRIVTMISVWFIVGGLLSGCFSTDIPTPTRSLAFVTVTPLPTGDVDAPASPTIDTLSTVTPIPSLTATPTQAGTSPEAPSPTPTLPPTPGPTDPYAVIDSPGGFLNVREGPGVEYGTPLGTYNNGATVTILGKQSDADNQLWWLIPFPTSPTGLGWIFANYTTAYNVEGVPWVNPAFPPGPEPPPEPTTPYAIIDSPRGFVFVQPGPGTNYEPPLGRLSNGALVDVIGKQYSVNGDLWWLIIFPPAPFDEGWVRAGDTFAEYTDDAPWVTAPPTPTPSPSATATASPTPTSTPTPTGEPPVNWTITGRIIDAVTAQPVGGASITANLGTGGPSLVTVADSGGNFSLTATAPDQGDLVLLISAQDYTDRVLTTAPRTPRTYNFPNIELEPTQPPTITWAISGRVTEVGTTNPISAAEIEAILGADGVRLGTVTDADGRFAVSGEASNSGNLTLTITAAGYQSNTFVSDQTDSRIYTLNDLQLVPTASSCLYESVLGLTETTALTRLLSLNFTTVSTVPIVADSSVGQVLTQQPEPPAEGESVRVGCQIPITLGIGQAE